MSAPQSKNRKTIKQRIEVLERRCVWLQKRIADSEDQEKTSYDRQELASLEWAIQTLTTLYARPIPGEPKQDQVNDYPIVTVEQRLRWDACSHPNLQLLPGYNKKGARVCMDCGFRCWVPDIEDPAKWKPSYPGEHPPTCYCRGRGGWYSDDNGQFVTCENYKPKSDNP
jgi:hypothetical protein